jgi:hypothetical protein
VRYMPMKYVSLRCIPMRYTLMRCISTSSGLGRNI